MNELVLIRLPFTKSEMLAETHLFSQNVPPDDLSVRQTLGAFEQYIPKNLFRDCLSAQHVCIGAVYRSKAVGLGLIRIENYPYLRWIFVDPVARYCGIGTFLLRGLLGATKDVCDSETVKCIFTSEMVEGGRPSGILKRAGFSEPQPAATGFYSRLDEIVAPKPVGSFAICPICKLRVDLYVQFEKALYGGYIPAFMDYAELENPFQECCLACLADGDMAGMLISERTNEGVIVRGIYIFPKYRRTGVASVLIAEGIHTARMLLPGDTAVYTSAINGDSFSLCMKIMPKYVVGKRTEYLTEFRYK